MRRLSLLVALCSLLVFAQVPAAVAQTSVTTLSLQGKVLDATQAPIAAARVTAVPDNQSSGPSTVTDQRGVFTLALAPGRYTVTIVADGFLEQSRSLTVPQTGAASLDVVLDVAGIREDVTVNAKAGYRA